MLLIRRSPPRPVPVNVLGCLLYLYRASRGGCSRLSLPAGGASPVSDAYISRCVLDSVHLGVARSADTFVAVP